MKTNLQNGKKGAGAETNPGPEGLGFGEAPGSAYVWRLVGDKIEKCYRDKVTLSWAEWFRNRGIGAKSIEYLDFLGVVTKDEPSPFGPPLSKRAENALWNAGIRTIPQAEYAVRSGTIVKYRGIGKNSIKELIEFLDLPNVF